MPTVTAKVIGAAALRKRMLALEPGIRKYVQPALAKSGDELVGMQKRFAPVAEQQGGELRDSIKWEWNPDNSLSILNKAGDDKAYYARWVEFGTVANPAQAFFFPAYRTQKRRIKSRIRTAVRKAVRGG